jgi:lambda family phage portal protein
MDNANATTPWLDRAISAAFPGWGLRRAAARAAMAQADAMRVEASYRGGVATRTDSPWPGQSSLTGQTALDRYRLRSMRDRSRKVDRDNPIGHGILDRLVDNVVGEGFTLRAATADKAFNAEAEERWGEWWTNEADIRGVMSGPELERQLQRAHERDGDGGLILVDERGRSRVQLIEADQIQTPQDAMGDPAVIDGVEMNAVGRPVAFHVYNAPERGTRNWTRVTANNFRYYPRLKRFNAVRGEPCFSQVFSLLDQIDGYVDAVVIAARMAAIFGLVFRENTAAKQFGGLPTMANSQNQQQKAVTLENGMVKYIGQGDDIVQVNPSQPTTGHGDFVASLLRLVGVPLDMPLELVLLDFSRVNFSSARAAFLQFYQAMRPKQGYFANRVLGPVYRWWLSRAVNAGEFTNAVPAAYWPHQFMPRGWQWVDPVSEAQAALLEISMGINSPQRVAARLGRDHEEILAETASAMAAMRLLDLPVVLSNLTRDPAALPAPDPTKPLPSDGNSKELPDGSEKV